MASLKTLSLAAMLALLFLSAVQVKATQDDDDGDDEDEDDDEVWQSRLISKQDDDDYEFGDFARVLARASDLIELETPDLPTSVLLKQLKRLLPAVDEDDDGFLEEDEIQQWMEKAVERIRTADTASTFDELDDDNDDKVSWEEHLVYHHDVKDTNDVEASLPHDPELKELQQRSLREDRELFDAADTDDDGYLTEEEHEAFREPDTFPHTLAVLYQQTMARKDEDGDGRLSRDEFVDNVDVDEDARPSEFDQEEDDDDNDDVLTKEEILDWLRNDYSTEIRATIAALFTTDDNRDGRLSLEELLEEPNVLREFPLLLEAGTLVRALDRTQAPRGRVEL